ncbi:MAG: insulinase family protein [Deltaproteobacteria bacterium]|nr:insulinase family protein [Deltaproteobacteria bacterium]
MIAPPQWHETTLPNGLRVVVVPQPALHRVAFGLFVGVGSRHESLADNGISHFLEHMLYRGTARHPSAHAQNLAFERLGGALSATTHADHTHLHVIAPPASFAESMALLGEVVRAPRLGEIDVEKRIVREEILDDLDETGRQVDPDNVVRAAMFGDHPLGFPITGPLEALDGFDEERLRAHLARYWVAANSVFAVAGRCDEREALALVEQHFGSMPRGERAVAAPWSNDAKGVVRRKHVASPGSQTDLRMSWVTPGERDPLGPAIELLLRVIDDGMSTRLYRRLADDGGMVYDCSALWEPFVEVGALDLDAAMSPERLPEVAQECFELVHDLAANGPTPDEVEKAKRRHRWSVEAAMDHAEDLEALAGGAVLFDRPRGFDAWSSRFDALGPKELRDAAAAVFRREAMHIATVGTLTAAGRLALRKLLGT